jgi:hypothetical protein
MKTDCTHGRSYIVGCPVCDPDDPAKVLPASATEPRAAAEQPPPDICRGQWYWVTDEPREPEESEGSTSNAPWLGCVVHVGSNYAELRAANGSHERIHLRDFDKRCTPEPDALAYIDRQIVTNQRETLRLMGQVRELTARLAISPTRTLTQEASTAALVLRATAQPVEGYKTELILAKEKTLPDLFAAIEASNKEVKTWMKARLIPTRAEVEELKEAVSGVEERIFHVELYAGLIESVAQIRKGTPARDGEKIRLMQRRAYMDEECLAHYEAGGMRFKDIKAFDRWMARPANFKRILPFPRCVIAFQVRRHLRDEGEEIASLSDFFRIIQEEELSKLTFLYLRNGNQLYRLSTAIDFGAQLFPDMDRRKLDGKIWAKMHFDTIEELATEGQYQQFVEDQRREAEEIAKLPEEERWRRRSFRFDTDRYVFFSTDTVYYDDITAYIQQQIKEHNRLVLVLQGLLDRSPVFLPHPPWSLWTTDGFTNALELIYDDARALTVGDKPDFDAYRAKLNASLKTGSVTVGQEDYWERIEASKENQRRARSRSYHRSEYSLKRHRPYGNHGPGLLAYVAKYTRTGSCLYEWKRPRARDNWRSDAELVHPCKLQVPASKILNVDAYTPGDYRIFFADPRTRSEYLKWAPLLLVAEDFHAGKRTIGGKK